MCKCACWLVFSSFLGVIFYLFDVATDLANGVLYLKRGHKYWGIATLVFVFLPVGIYFILLFIYGLIECCSGDKRVDRPKRFSATARLLKLPYWRSAFHWMRPKRDCKSRMFSYTMILCRLEPVVSYVQCIRHGLQGKRETIYKNKKQFQIFVETCLESLPQIALQIYIIGRKSSVSGFQILSLLASTIAAWYVLTYMQIEQKKQASKTKVWIIKMLWCIFGGIPTLLGSFPAISFFSAVYHPYYLSLYIILLSSLSIKWVCITTLRKYNKLSIRTMICLILSLIKVGLAIMITFWYVSIKTFQEPALRKAPVVFLIPSFVWPNTQPDLLKLAITKSDLKHTPPWAKCDRLSMIRNGTFVIDTKKWLTGHTLTQDIGAFFRGDDLFCISDIANFIYCTVLYSLVVWFVWDIFFYLIRCCVPSDRDDPDEPQEGGELLHLM